MAQSNNISKIQLQRFAGEVINEVRLPDAFESYWKGEGRIFLCFDAEVFFPQRSVIKALFITILRRNRRKFYY